MRTSGTSDGPGLIERARGGDPRALGRAITLVEDGSRAGRRLLAEAFPHTGRARIIGLTGPPGVGKSSLTSRLTAHYRKRGLKVGIVAVDPSSPFTGGAVLGDRIRMTEHFTDPGVFIRSMATRGHLGGLAATTADVADLLDIAGHDLVLIETIGVGQEEIEVSRVAHLVVLVLAPGLGDEIQVMKSGIMEVGDLFVVHKADLDGAERAEAALRSILQISGLEESRPVLKVSSLSGLGVGDLAAAIDAAPSRMGDKELVARAGARARERIRAVVQAAIARRVFHQMSGAVWEEQVAKVAARGSDPYQAAGEVLALLGMPREE